jgi:hypothetical protein
MSWTDWARVERGGREPRRLNRRLQIERVRMACRSLYRTSLHQVSIPYTVGCTGARTFGSLLLYPPLEEEVESFAAHLTGKHE